MVHTAARKHPRPYIHHKWFTNRNQDDRWIWFASGFLWASALAGLLLLTVAKHQDAVNKSKLIDPTRVILKSATYEKPLDTKTHITYISKVEVLSPTVAQVNNGGVPTPFPTQLPVRTHYTAPHNEITEYIDQVWGKDGGLGTRIASAESSLDNDAIHYNRNGTYDYCTFQLNSVHGLSKEYLSDYHNCIKEAYKLFKAQGTQPWLSSKSKWEL